MSDDVEKGDGQPPGSGPEPILPRGPSSTESVVARAEGNPGHNVIWLRSLSSDGSPVGEDISVGRAGFNNHSPSVSSIGPGAQDGGPIRGIDIAWIETAAGDASGLGRVMWQRLAANLQAANDNATWVTGHDQAGAFGSEPSIVALTSGETLIAWIGADGHAHGRLYAPNEAGAGENADAPAYAAINASLADLGPVAATPEGSRRVQVTESRPGNLAIMWLALADHGFVIRGSMFAAPFGGPDEGNHSWTETPVADIRPPSGFMGPFSLQGAGDGSADVVITYLGHGSAAPLSHRIEAPADRGERGHVGPEFADSSEHSIVEAGQTSHYVARERGATGDGGASDATAAGAHVVYAQGEGAHAALALYIPEAGGSAGNPLVTAIKDGFAVTWETPGDAEGVVAIKMAIFNSQGVAHQFSDGSTVVTVTDNALAKVAPSIAETGDGASVAYVDADQGGLIIKTYDGDGSQLGTEVVVDDGSDGAVSEIAMDSHHEGHGKGEELAVVYVKDDHDDRPDYGYVYVQRYQVPDEDHQSEGLIALGIDGQSDGNDAPVALTEERDGDPTTIEDAVGRAPTVAGLEAGELAVVWVESDGTRETIRGSVLEADGDQVLRIDLTDLVDGGGIAKGSKPILLANGDGDILVSWLQQDGSNGHDGYVVMAALYHAAGEGQWIAPDAPIRLQAFDEEPEDFSVAWSDIAGSAIDVVWRDDGSGKGGGDGVLSQRYDLAGNDVGQTQKLGKIDVDKIAPDTLSAAGLNDGQIVVVYAEQSKDGDLDPATHVVDTTSADGGAQPLSGTNSGSAIPESIFSTSVDQEIAIGVSQGATVSHVNGTPITSEVPVDIGSGWIQLREDGHLTFSPDAGYSGDIAFDYTVDGDSSGTGSSHRVQVSVTADESSGSDALNGHGPGPSGNIESGDVRVADIALSGGDINLDALSQAGLDADLFKIVGTTLYLKAGIDFDFGSNAMLSVEIRSSGPGDGDQTVNFPLELENGHGHNALMDHAMTADTFLFAPGFGTPENHSGSSHHEIIDVSSSGYATFQELIDSGALVQAGDDVVLTFDPAHPDHSDKITLRGIDLSVLTSADFKF